MRQESPPLFPIFVRLEGRLCTVVGGGEVATRKVRSLLEAGATVRVVAPKLAPALKALVEKRAIEHVPREYGLGDLEGSVLAFAATDSRRINEAVWREAEGMGVLVNVADDPYHCSFILPAKVDRHPISIAICTGGASPALARHLRQRIEETVPPEYQKLARLLGRLRPEALAVHASPEERRARWQHALQSDVLALLRVGRHREAEAVAREVLGLSPRKVRRRRGRQMLVIGARGSALARAQAGEIASQLAGSGTTIDIRVIRTTGDRTRGALSEAGTGVFVKEIEEALLRGEVDIAVHSMKDLPTGPREGLAVAAVPVRQDSSDALVSRAGVGLSQLPSGSRVGTSSPRRVAQLRAYRQDLVFLPIRGNLDTRLRKLSRGDFDALVVAYAGLVRLGLTDLATESISLDVCLPAPAQGALALQIRESDSWLHELLAQVDDRPSRLAVTAERAFLARQGAGCSLPVGALAVVGGDRILLRIAVAHPEGRQVVRRQEEGPAEEAEMLGRRLAEAVLAEGADRLLAGETW